MAAFFVQPKQAESLSGFRLFVYYGGEIPKGFSCSSVMEENFLRGLILFGHYGGEIPKGFLLFVY